MLTSRDTVLALAVAGGSLLASCDAFVPSSSVKAFTAASPALRAASTARPLRTAGLRMGYLDEVDNNDAGKRNSAGLDAQGKQVMATVNYEEFVDCEDGFDGGDGQVGVVGDGSNAMDNFFTPEVSSGPGVQSLSAIGQGGTSGKISEAVGGVGKVSGGTKDGRVDKRWNAWGSDMADITEELKAQGVEQIDVLTGEDVKTVQRQQLNNWYAQRAVWAKESAQREDMEQLAGNEHRQSGTSDYFAELAKGKSSDELTEKEKENVIFATGARGVENKEALVKHDWKPCTAGTRIDGEYTIRGEGMVTIEIEPNSMVAEQYIARFADGSDAGCFVVAKTGYDLGAKEAHGTLPRRGHPVEFFVRFTPSGPTGPPKVATLVLDAEDGWKWTFKITGST